MRAAPLMVLSILAGAVPTFAIAQAGGQLEYSTDAARRNASFTSQAAALGTVNQGLGNIAATIARHIAANPQMIDSYFARYGMKSNDLGDVMAFAYFNAVMMADNGRTDDPTQAQMNALRAQIRGANTGALAALSNSEKQDAADKFLFTLLVQQAVAEGITDKTALAPWLTEFAKVNSAMLGFDVYQAQIGPKGIEPKNGGSSSQAAPRPTPAPTPVRGIRSNGADAILGVDYESRLHFVPGFNGGGLNRSETVTVLFKDGSVCIDCLDRYVDGDLAVLQREEPDQFGRWTRRGGTYQLRFSDGDTDEIEAADLRGPAPAGTRLNGLFETSGGVYTGIAQTMTSEDLMMTPDGRFAWNKSGGAMGMGYTAWNQQATTGGRYTIDGFTIRFDFDDGRSETLGFVLWDSDKDFIILDGSAYWIDDDD